ncbi:MAG: hypothetical protein ACE15E_20305, partial [Acidobacteriota bacterium]
MVSGATRWPGIWLRNVLLLARYSGRWHPLIEEAKQQLVEVATEQKREIDYRRNKLGVYLDGEVITGLLAYHDAFKDQAALEAAAAKGRYIVENHAKTAHYYKAIAVERLLAPAEETGDGRFQKAGVEIAGEVGLNFLRLKEGVKRGRRSNQAGHEVLAAAI